MMNLHIEGITKSKAAEVGRTLANKAGAVIDRERQVSLGITYAIWRYANAPCMKNPSNPTDAETRKMLRIGRPTGSDMKSVRDCL